MQYSYFSLYSVFPHKNVHPFRNIVQFLPTPTLYKVETGEKNLDLFQIHASNFFLWGEGRGWACGYWKTPYNAKVSQDFCPWL